MDVSPRVGDVMARYPYITDKKTPVAKAFEVMDERKIRHLPVVEHNKLIGVVSDRDLRLAMGGATEKKALCVEDVMVFNPYKVRRGTSLQEVVLKMSQKKFGCALIEDENDHVVGIFTTTDALRVLSELLIKDPSLEYNRVGIEDFSYPLEALAI